MLHISLNMEILFLTVFLSFFSFNQQMCCFSHEWMAPHVVDMTAEEPCSPAVLSPVGEGKLGSEENSRKQEVTGTEPEMSKGKQSAVNDR